MIKKSDPGTRRGANFLLGQSLLNLDRDLHASARCGVQYWRPFLTDRTRRTKVSFATRRRTYKGYCTPHLALGMKIAIKVE